LFIIKGDNEHIAVRVLQDLTTLSKTQSIQIHDVEIAITTAIYSIKNG
jgi:hypothetical protein